MTEREVWLRGFDYGIVLAGVVRLHGRAPVTWCQDDCAHAACAVLRQARIDWERDNPVVAQAERLLLLR